MSRVWTTSKSDFIWKSLSAMSTSCASARFRSLRSLHFATHPPSAGARVTQRSRLGEHRRPTARAAFGAQHHGASFEVAAARAGLSPRVGAGGEAPLGLRKGGTSGGLLRSAISEPAGYPRSGWPAK